MVACEHECAVFDDRTGPNGKEEDSLLGGRIACGGTVVGDHFAREAGCRCRSGSARYHPVLGLAGGCSARGVPHIHLSQGGVDTRIIGVENVGRGRSRGGTSTTEGIGTAITGAGNAALSALIHLVCLHQASRRSTSRAVAVASGVGELVACREGRDSSRGDHGRRARTNTIVLAHAIRCLRGRNNVSIGAGRRRVGVKLGISVRCRAVRHARQRVWAALGAPAHADIGW
jgi:hypothetical protein